jgi:CTP synthase (UTP-ammonia lyase)
MSHQQRKPLEGSPTATIGIVGDRNPDLHVHVATDTALTHVREPVPFKWIPTDAIASDGSDALAGYSALLISPGSPYRSMEGALTAIRFAREREIPLLGTCGGFQHIVVEFVRNVLGVEGADHEETSPGAPRLAVTALACSLAGQDHPVRLTRGSRIAAICGEATVEPFFCRYGLSPEYRPALERHGFTVTGVDEHGEPRVLELARHPFFFATLYVPQARSRPGEPHPLLEAFVAAARQRALTT